MSVVPPTESTQMRDVECGNIVSAANEELELRYDIYPDIKLAQALLEVGVCRQYWYSDSSNICIAGGFLRDLILGREAKDIDLVCSEGMVLRIIKSIKASPTVTYKEKKTINGVTFAPIKICYTYEDKEITLDIKAIVDGTPADNKHCVDSIQCNLCSISWNLTEGFYYSWHFLRGIQDKVLYPIDGIENWNEGTDMEWKHPKKMKAYFPDYKFLYNMPEDKNVYEEDSDWDMS